MGAIRPFSASKAETSADHPTSPFVTDWERKAAVPHSPGPVMPLRHGGAVTSRCAVAKAET